MTKIDSIALSLVRGGEECGVHCLDMGPPSEVKKKYMEAFWGAPGYTDKARAKARNSDWLRSKLRAEALQYH
jgi:hypothetical protein